MHRGVLEGAPAPQVGESDVVSYRLPRIGGSDLRRLVVREILDERTTQMKVANMELECQVLERQRAETLALETARTKSDFLATMNEQLVLSGKVTPTMMFARMRPEMIPGKETNQFEHLSPAFCIHPVELADPAARRAMIQDSADNN